MNEIFASLGLISLVAYIRFESVRSINQWLDIQGFVMGEDEFACMSCGLIFDVFSPGIDSDDVHCPDCSSTDLLGKSEYDDLIDGMQL